MKKNVVVAASLCVSAIALGIAAYSIYSMKAYQPDILPAQSAATEESTEGQTAETNMASVNTVLGISDGNLVLAGNPVALQYGDEYISVLIPDTAKDIEYFEGQGCVSWAEETGHIKVSAVSANDIDKDFARSFDSDDNKLIAGVKKVSDTAGINVVANAPKGTADALQETVNTVIESAAPCSGMTVQVCDLAIAPEWSVSMAKNVLCLTHDDDRVTVSSYSDSLDGAGFDQNVDVNGIAFTTGNYKDSESGFSPFMHKCEDGTLKVMAISSDVMGKVFSAAEENAQPAESAESTESVEVAEEAESAAESGAKAA